MQVLALSYRRKGIRGRDVAAIMGISPFATNRDLYYDKIGVTPVIEEEESNWVAKEVGHRLEDLVAEIFSKKTGLEVFPVRKMFRHPLYPFMLSDVDFFIHFPDGSYGILECKKEYEGKYYTLSEKRIPYQRDKTRKTYLKNT